MIKKKKKRDIINVDAMSTSHQDCEARSQPVWR